MAKNWSMGLGRQSAMEDRLIKGLERKRECSYMGDIVVKKDIPLPEKAWTPERWEHKNKGKTINESK